MSKILIMIREAMVIFYEISCLCIPAVAIYLFWYTKVDILVATGIIALWVMPYAVHAGIFGEWAKKYIDKLMGY